MTYHPVDFGDPDINMEINYLAAELDESPAQWWWLSFCDTDRLPGEQFNGACVVLAPNLPMAIQVAWENNCNPGGQVLGLILEGETITNWERAHPNEKFESFTNELLLKAVIERYQLF